MRAACGQPKGGGCSSSASSAMLGFRACLRIPQTAELSYGLLLAAGTPSHYAAGGGPQLPTFRWLEGLDTGMRGGPCKCRAAPLILGITLRRARAGRRSQSRPCPAPAPFSRLWHTPLRFCCSRTRLPREYRAIRSSAHLVWPRRLRLRLLLPLFILIAVSRSLPRPFNPHFLRTMSLFRRLVKRIEVPDEQTDPNETHQVCEISLPPDSSHLTTSRFQ